MSKKDKLTYLEKWEALNLKMLEEVGLGMSCSDDKSSKSKEDDKRLVKHLLHFAIIISHNVF